MQKRNSLFRCVLLLFLIGLLPSMGIAQEETLRPVTDMYAIKNATIIPAPGKVIQNGTILIDNGIIKAVGTNVSIPSEAWVVEADSMFVYAGFISGLSTIGIEKPKEELERPDRKLTGNPPNDYAGITPERSAADMLSTTEKSIADFRKLGFTAAHSVSDKGMLPGTGAIVLLGGATAQDMIVKKDASMFSQLAGAGGVYPNTVIGVMAKYRDLYRKSSQSRDYARRYASNPSGMERPEADAVLEALYPVVGKSLPVMFEAKGVKDIMRVKALQQDLGFTLIYGEVQQGWDAISAFKASNSPIFLSLDLPEMKEEEEKDEEDSEDEEEPTAEEVEKDALEKRQKEIVKKYYTQPAALSQAGVRFGFSTMDVKSKDFKSTVLKVMENGLSADKALAALTTEPASILGLSSTMGTIEAGKMANLIVSDTAYFSENSNVRFVFVDGVKYEYEVKKKKKKSSSDEAVDPSGKWSYSAETPQGTAEGIITITGSPGEFEGTMTLNMNESTNKLEGLAIDGNTVTFSVNTNVGQVITIDVSMTIDGDTMEGSISVAEFGSFPMEGSKEPEN